jgi:hypothetical protein
MAGEPEIEWEQVTMSGQALDHWMARVAAPRSVVFASVNRMLDGNWKVNFSPKGRGLHDPITYVGPYLTREKAMKHVERWAHFHWAKVPAEPPRGLARP